MVAERSSLIERKAVALPGAELFALGTAAGIAGYSVGRTVFVGPGDSSSLLDGYFRGAESEVLDTYAVGSLRRL